MTNKIKIIKRLNRGFGFSIPLATNWECRLRLNKNIGAFSWFLFCGIGSCETACKVLKWKKWVIDVKRGEILEYKEDKRDFYNKDKWSYLIERRK